MMITVDTSALIAVVACEPSRERALELTCGHRLVAPASVHWEMGNAFSAMLKRGRVSLEQATACLVAYNEIPLRLVDVDLIQAISVSAKYNIYAYDAYLLVCCLQFKSPLLSLDEPLKKTAVALGIQVLEA